jgi:Zn-dependent protease
MLGDLFNNPISFFLWLFALVVAIDIHEFSHALLADRLGDPTPRMQGRLTLNPMAHLDTFGTIMLLIAHFGWGKPVQFDPYNLRNPRRDAAIISIAGPISNLILASLCSLLLRILLALHGSIQGNTILSMINYGTIQVLQPVIVLNIMLAIFNLVPVHPLDGFKIVGGILSPEQAREWNKLERYGMIILLFLIFPFFGSISPIQQVISPIINVLVSILLPGSGSTGII